MLFQNPNSKRQNPFRQVYDSEEFKTVLQHRDNIPEFPYLVDIELTNHCNLECIFCWQQCMTRDKGFISEELFKKVVHECSQHNTPIRLIRWGEPFLHRKIISFLEYAKSEKLLVHITTNGLAMTNKHMKLIVDVGLDSLIVSFQGATKEQYEIMRQNHRYDELRGNILRMLEIRADMPKPFIHISSTMTNEAEQRINEFVNHWGHLVDSVSIGKTNLSRMTAHEIKSFESIGKLEVLKKQETINKYYRPCTEVYQKLSVDWDGKVTCCCGDYDRYLTVGGANESTLLDIWNQSKELEMFRHLLDNNLHRSLTLCSTCYHTYEEF